MDEFEKLRARGEGLTRTEEERGLGGRERRLLGGLDDVAEELEDAGEVEMNSPSGRRRRGIDAFGGDGVRSSWEVGAESGWVGEAEKSDRADGRALSPRFDGEGAGESFVTEGGGKTDAERVVGRSTSMSAAAEGEDAKLHENVTLQKADTCQRGKRLKKDSPSTMASAFSSLSPRPSSSPFPNIFPASSADPSSSKAEGGPNEADPTGRRRVFGTTKLLTLLEPSESGGETTLVSGAMEEELARFRAIGRARELPAFLLGGRARIVEGDWGGRGRLVEEGKSTSIATERERGEGRRAKV